MIVEESNGAAFSAVYFLTGNSGTFKSGSDLPLDDAILRDFIGAAGGVSNP